MNTVMNIFLKVTGQAPPLRAVWWHSQSWLCSSTSHQTPVTSSPFAFQLSTLNFQLSSPNPIADSTSTQAGVDARGPCAQVKTDGILAGSAGRKCILFHGTIRGWLCD